MLRTVRWIFKKPWGLWEFFVYPKETIAWVKTYIIANWYNDVLKSDISREHKRTMLHFITWKTGLLTVKGDEDG